MSTMTCSIMLMGLCVLQLRVRLNGRKTYTLPWSLRAKSGPTLILKLLLRQVCGSFLHISWILCGSCDRVGSGRWEWILILQTRLHILPNTSRSLWSRWRINSCPKCRCLPVIEPEGVLSNNPSSSAMASISGQSSDHQYDLSSDDEE